MKRFLQPIFLRPVFETLAQNSHDTEWCSSSLNAKFINNFVTNDSVEHSKIIHKDFVCISSMAIHKQTGLPELVGTWI
jgi:hypothetical protein